MSNVVHFSQAFENLLNGPLNPRGRPHGRASSPPGLTNDEMRIDAKVDPNNWLRGIAKKTKDPKFLRVTDNIAIMTEIVWDTPASGIRTLTEAHCQAIVVEGTSIDGVLAGKNALHVQYLRADFEPGNLGDYVFPDPLSHVHANQKGEPRFALSISPTTTHLDFFELVLRNYARNAWQAWADDVWQARVRVRLGNDPTADVKSMICNAFRENAYEQLCNDPLKDAVRRWRKALRKEKSKMTEIVQDTALSPINY